MHKRKLAGLFLLVSLAMALSCARQAYRTTNKIYRQQARTFARQLRQFPLRDSLQQSAFFAGTTNFTLRKPNFVVIHHTAQSTCDSTLHTFTLTATKVSAHYVICRSGVVFHMLNDYLRAHHAGISRWGNATDLNSSSIGIEIDNNGFEPFTQEQLHSLLLLLDRLKKAYNIPQANFIGHADVAPGRKVDPSRFFPWQRLAENGFGFWYDTTNVNVPADFNPVQALRIIGYAISDTGTAIQSYKIHFMPQDTTRTIQEADRKILFDLMRKYS